MTWENKKVLITGGLGFVGSNLARNLVDLGAAVVLVDNMLPGHGGNLFNLAGIEKKVATNFADVCSIHAMNHLVQNQDIIFHLAGQVNHVASMLDPLSDLQINTQGTLTVLEACRKYNPQARVVFSGTRGSYGRCQTVPVNEEHPLRPLGVYAVTNAAAEQLLRLYHDSYGIETVMLRITNTFGPRHQMRHNQYGIVNWFLRQALDGEDITVMGDGSIQRDYLYIDDLIEGLKAAATSSTATGEIINLGSGAATTFLDLAEEVIAVTGSGSIKMIPFSNERKILEPGHYVADASKARKLLGWESRVSRKMGLEKTIAFYRQHQQSYW